MKKILVLLVLISACTGKEKTETVFTANDFEAKYKSTQGAILLDVRTLEEVANGKIANAQNIIYDDAFADKLSGLENKPIFVYCGSGIRSAKAAAILREKGYDNVFELEGGLKAWKAAGLPVE
jgi:thioredoxin 1